MSATDQLMTETLEGLRSGANARPVAITEPDGSRGTADTF